MIEQIPLFFDRKKNQYYYVGICQCSGCKEQIDKVVVLRHSWSKNYFNYSKYCLNCFNKNKGDYGTVVETRTAQICLKRPNNAFHVLIQPPTLEDGNNRTVFSVADENLEGESVNDLTRYSGRESLEGCKIGAFCEVECDEQNKEVGTDDAKRIE